MAQFHSRHGGALSVLLLVCCTTIPLLAGQSPADSNQAKHKAVAEDLFAKPEVFRIQIEISDRDMDTLRETGGRAWPGGNSGGRPTVKAIVREGDKVYKEVALHLKGAAGSYQSVDDRPALTLNFDKFVKGQTFHGIKRISLNNSVQDHSLLTEQICRELFATAGVPVPRANHAKVTLNGKSLGVYVLVEAFNKQFLARHFGSANGNLYDGGFVQDIDGNLQKSSGPNPNDRSDLERLVQATEEPDRAKRVEKLKRCLDWNEFITELAFDVIMCDWDGYGMNRNNYRIYHDPTTDKIVFMPHGLDQMFGVERVSPDMPIFPPMQGMVARAVLQTPEGRRDYRERLSQLATNFFHAAALTNRVRELTAVIQPALAEDGPNGASWQRSEAADLCRRITERAESLREQLSAPSSYLKFDSAGIATLLDWQPKADFGHPVLEKVNEGGRTLLHIRASGSCVGVWSVKVNLEPGRYRLEGKARSAEVKGDAGDRRAGAGLRVDRRRFDEKLMGTKDWTPVVFEFDVDDARTPFGFFGPMGQNTSGTELICELRAAQGEVWFDLGSLQLKRE